ncbi:MAG: hypothetical protein M1823_006097 [Watsoniomyces obsoletus]|nr:MAG: hypothetical protein M1823_006097 [Watsoniomyces obsoletus]
MASQYTICTRMYDDRRWSHSQCADWPVTRRPEMGPPPLLRQRISARSLTPCPSIPTWWSIKNEHTQDVAGGLYDRLPQARRRACWDWKEQLSISSAYDAVSSRSHGFHTRLLSSSLLLDLPSSSYILSQAIESTSSRRNGEYSKLSPKVWLHSQDPYHPSDIATHVQRTTPQTRFTKVNGAPAELTLDNLDGLNALGTDGGKDIWLTSKDDITTNPSWLNGASPDAAGKINGAIPCVVIVTDHGGGKVDAFYFYFYTYNQGNTLFGIEIGSHVGDWEHNMIRFQDGTPQAIWYSQHATGEAFTWAAVEKDGLRPLAYSAKGSHAYYPTPGRHDYTIPNVNTLIGALVDYTDRGKLWDPIQSAYTYIYDKERKDFIPTEDRPNQPTGFLRFNGRWGDEQYPDSDRRQRKVFWIGATAKYSGGPTGPRDKNLQRKNVCPDDGKWCFVKPADFL